ncbi:isochorismatase family protein [Billgrantia endophytica]|uniref:isochorismatase n=1 Tax=Billgrantia endophytica TaxID=2033802 RepID=A0A2N7TZI8_9GAMM|nr:isochorismatase family protein [Halomonas endophytica]PMR73607.1 isochorismatase [Halomonas endophytica]
MSIPSLPDYPMPVHGTLPDNRVDWQLDPTRAALLIHDMQRYFLSFYGEENTLVRQLVDNLASLRRWCKAQGIPVIYTAQPHKQQASSRGLLNDIWGPGLTDADPQLQPIIEALAPDDDDTVLVKWRYSAFQRSELAALLGDLGRDQLLIGGVYTHIGCLATALDAFMRDIQVFLVADATADFSSADHEMALRFVANRCGCVVDTTSLMGTASDLTREWLESRVRQSIDDDVQLDPTENLIFYGLDSIQVMTLAAELKAHGVHLSFEELVSTPTLEAWWSLVEQQVTKAAVQ